MSTDEVESLTWAIDDVNGLDRNAFKNTNSIFYACNTGTEVAGKPFAQEWSNKTGGTTEAVVGKTYYGNINETVWYDFFGLYSKIYQMANRWLYCTSSSAL